MDKDYGIAQFCMNGHLISFETNDDKILQTHCSKCGESVINKCLECDTNIRGGIRHQMPIAYGQESRYRYYSQTYNKPLYCIHCGNPYPWTKSSEEAAYELIEFATSLNQTEKDDWKRSIPELLKDSPKTNVAAIKFKTYAQKAGNEIAKGVKEVIVGIISESVKKAIWGS